MGPHNCGYTIELYSIIYTIHSLKTIRGWNVSRVQKYPPYGQVGSAINVHTAQHSLTNQKIISHAPDNALSARP